jgi:hypothetical protein
MTFLKPYVEGETFWRGCVRETGNYLRVGIVGAVLGLIMWVVAR